MGMFERAHYITVGAATAQGARPCASPVAFWLTPAGCSIGLCFAISPGFQKALGLSSDGYSECILSIPDSQAPLTAEPLRGVGMARVLATDGWAQALQGLRSRFPNVHSDVSKT